MVDRLKFESKNNDEDDESVLSQKQVGDFVSQVPDH